MGVICDVPGTVTEKYADSYDFECWIMCIGRNRAISYLRQLDVKKNKEFQYNPDIVKQEREQFKVEELKDVLEEDEYKIIIMKYVFDYTFEEIANAIKNEKEILLCGSDANKMTVLISEYFSDKIKCYTQNFDLITTNSLFSLAEKKIANNEETLKDFEGPTYLRASEAEENLKA